MSSPPANSPRKRKRSLDATKCEIRRYLNSLSPAILYDHLLIAHDGLTVSKRAPRTGAYFTDDDLAPVRKWRDQEEEAYQRKTNEDEAKADDEDKRWKQLRMKWASSDEPDEVAPGVTLTEVPRAGRGGIFHVSQDVNNGYDTFDSFVVVARNEEEARRTNPSWGDEDAFTYHGTPLERNEEWAEAMGGKGPAPGWYLGKGNSHWCHGGYVKVRRISDYVPPDGEDPKYGIISFSFNAG
jgi:hypothetical protein